MLDATPDGKRGRQERTLLIEYGRALAVLAEARRCLDTMMMPAAVARPRLAWSLLPRGLADVEAERVLVGKPIEADAALVWPQHVAMLRERCGLAASDVAALEDDDGD